MAGVGQQHFPLALDLRAHVAAQRIHPVTGSRDIFEIDVVGRQICLAAINEAMAGEINQYPIVVFGDRGQPFFEFITEARERGSGTHQFVHVFRAKISALGADQDRVDRFRIALRKLKLLRRGKVLVIRDPHHQRVTARNAHDLWLAWNRNQSGILFDA